MRVRVGHRLNLNDSGSDFDSSFRFRFLTILDSDSFKRQGKKSLHVLNFSQYINIKSMNLNINVMNFLFTGGTLFTRELYF